MTIPVYWCAAYELGDEFVLGAGPCRVPTADGPTHILDEGNSTECSADDRQGRLNRRSVPPPWLWRRSRAQHAGSTLCRASSWSNVAWYFLLWPRPAYPMTRRLARKKLRS